MRESRLSVATWNVHKCRGTRGFRPEEVARAIARLGVQVLALQEVDRRFGPERGVGLILPSLLASTGMRAVPLSPLADGLGWHGNAILLRDGLCHGEIARVDLPGAEPRGAVSVEVLRQGAEPGTPGVRFVAMHLGLLAHSRRKQARAILEWVAGMPPRPTVLLGDTNEWRPFGSLATMIGPDGHTGRAGASFPSGMPMVGFDRIIALQGVTVRARRVIDDASVATVSDHLPVSATVEVNPEPLQYLPGIPYRTASAAAARPV